MEGNRYAPTRQTFQMKISERLVAWAKHFRQDGRSQGSPESSSSHVLATVSSGNSPISSSLHVIMCRFIGGKVEKQLVNVDNTSFLAVSHVWGAAKWRIVRGVNHKVLVSKSKAEFMEQQLPSIVGDGFFWMDILCIDQTNRDARVVVTQHIPTIFRKALRTILVRDGCGMRQCCALAVEGFMDWKLYSKRLDFHTLTSHRYEDLMEGVLSRLWVLEEIVVSNIIQFVTCKETKAKTIYKSSGLATARVDDGLIKFALAWSSEDTITTGSDAMNFIQAFVNNSLVSRTATIEAGEDQSQLLPPQNFWQAITSTRRSTKPRDYILATMPQFGFYRLPKNIRAITFSELFLDCAYQMHAIIRTQLSHDTTSSPLDIPIDTTKFIEVPEPTCLGDLVKLFQACFLFADICNLHRTIDSAPDPEHQYNILCPITSHSLQLRLTGRKHPVDFNYIDASTDMEIIVTLVKNGTKYSDLRWNNAAVGGLYEFERQAMESRRKCPLLFRNEINEFLIAMSVLNTMALEQYHPPEDALIDLNSVFNSRGGDLKNCLDYTILLAAMISCGLSLSAFEWSKTHLCPISIHFRNETYLALIPQFILGLRCQLYLVLDGWILPTSYLLAITHPGKLYTACLFPPEVVLRMDDENNEATG